MINLYNQSAFHSSKIIITISQYNHLILSKFSVNSQSNFVNTAVYMSVGCNCVFIWEVRCLIFRYVQLR
jgi:hypothetical protein